ncbi:MAG: lytic murein transglycosylase B [Betaproteobacteria bacterium RIFCSPLOWO2_02_FULL_62_17]|nr:MAG: lytic murein transglycosylase B [Betaproteobacteria bacterium RIFCSPLOWO2_02_FULL_62_17]
MRLIALLAIVFTCAAPGALAQNYAAREEVRRFIAQMVEQHGFHRGELVTLFSKVRHQSSVLRAVSAPAESAPRSWQVYRSRFVNPGRIAAGVQFYERHAQALERAAKLYGVPEEIIVAIIGVETVYGRNVGGYRVIDALATLAFDYPQRAEYFRGELEQFLLHARQEYIDVLGLKGSYAGAIGIPQFMPGSYRRYAVDFDGDGRRDLSGSVVDALGSVANFLKEHGWQRAQPIAFTARVVGERFRVLLASGIKPVYRGADLASFEVSVEEDVDPEMGVALIELESAGQVPEYRVGLENFYVLTRYNRSSFYAIAVFELATEIASTVAKQRGAAASIR